MCPWKSIYAPQFGGQKAPQRPSTDVTWSQHDACCIDNGPYAFFFFSEPDETWVWQDCRIMILLRSIFLFCAQSARFSGCPSCFQLPCTAHNLKGYYIINHDITRICHCCSTTTPTRNTSWWYSLCLSRGYTIRRCMIRPQDLVSTCLVIRGGTFPPPRSHR